MVESKDNVKVAIRIRPLNDRETSEGSKKCVIIKEAYKTLTIGDHKNFTYDYVADEDTSQEKIFEMVGKPIASSCMSGYNGTIFAYGQTGSGKTFTIQGAGAEEISSDSATYHLRGVLPRCFEYIFSSISSALKTGNIEFLVKCSYLEIYQEQIHDLLDPNPQSLQLREDMKKGAYVEGLIEDQVKNLVETYQLLKIGARNRHVSSTSMNKESSRSHSVFTMHIESKTNSDGLINFKSSRFNLIDLAGSERQKSTACLGERLKEAGMINKSLSALGNVINSLVELSEGKPRHVPYRDSKLTFLLKDSLGGNSKTFIIANISSAVSSFSETLSTLKFAQRAKLIKNSAVINEDTSGTVLLLKNEVKRLKEELENIKAIADIAVSTCPKCAGINQISVPSLLKTFEKNSEAEILLESNLRLRLTNENKFVAAVNEKDTLIESLKNVIVRMENKANHDKMILKFRNATIAKLQTGEEDKDITSLKKENEMLREECENNPITAKLTLENKILCDEIAEMKTEVESGFGRLKEENEQLKEFTGRLCESMKASNSEREKLKKVFTEISGGKDFDEVFKGIEAEYLQEIKALKETIKDLSKENSQILVENRMIHQNYLHSFEGEDNLLDCNLEDILNNSRIMSKPDEELKRLQEKVEKREKEIEELKLKLVTETQTKDTLFIEKRSLEKTLFEITEENCVLKELKEKFTILESQLEFVKTNYEEKYTEYILATQEIDNLTESGDYLKSEIKQLNAELTDKKRRIQDQEHYVNILEKQVSEQAAMIIALQDPTGNKTLALALSECEHYKAKSLELEQELLSSKKQVIDLTAQVTSLSRQYEETNRDLNASKATLIELKDILALSKKTISDLKESEQTLLDEVEGLKEIVEREKHHNDILRERMISKHNEAINKLNIEKTELVKEVDTLKNNSVKLHFEMYECKAKENLSNEKLISEVSKTERITNELIEAKVAVDRAKNESFEVRSKLEQALVEIQTIEAREKKKTEDFLKEIAEKREEFLKERERVVEEWKSRNKALSEENLEKKLQIEMVKNEHSEVLRRNTELVETCEGIEFALKEVKEEKEIIEKKFLESYDENQSLVVECKKHKEKVFGLENDNRMIQETTQMIIKEKEAAFAELENKKYEIKKLKQGLQAEIEKSEKIKIELQEEIQKRSIFLEEYKQKCDKYEVALPEVTKANDSLRLTLKSAESAQAAQKSLISSLESSKSQLKLDNESLNAAIEKLTQSTKAQLSTVQSEFEKEQKISKCLKLELDSIKVVQEEMLKKYNSNLKKHSELEDKLKCLSAEFAESESIKISALSQCEELKIQISAEVMKNTELNAGIKELNIEIHELKRRLIDNKQLEAAKKELEECLKKNSELFLIIEAKNIKSKEQEQMCINLLNEKEQNSILIDALNTEIEALKSSLKDMKLSVEDNKALVFTLKNENNDLKFNLSKSHEETNALVKDIQNKNQVIYELENERNAVRVKVGDLSEEVGLRDAEIKDAEEVKKELENKMQELITENQINEAKIENFVKEVREKEQKIVKLSYEFNDKSDKLTQVIQKLTETERESQEIIQQLKKATVTVSSLELSLSKSSCQVEDLQLALSNSESSLKNLELLKASELSDLSQKLKSSESFTSVLQKQLSDVSTELSSKKSEILSMTSENSSLTAQINDLYSSQEVLRKEFEMSQNEVKALKEELRIKNEAIKVSSVNMTYTREELLTWKKCIEEKNATILDLKNQLELLKSDMERNKNDKYHEKQCEYLTKLLEVKESEVKELKSKGLDGELETSFEAQKRELEIAAKRQEALKAELVSIKNDFSASLQSRETLMEDLRSIRDDEIRNKREISESKKLLAKLKDENQRFMKEISKLNEENIRLSETPNDFDRSASKVKKLEETVTSLEAQVKIKNNEIEKYNKRLMELRRKAPEEGLLRKEIEKQAEEINNLTDGLAKITDFVFGLPGVSNDDEEASIIDGTIKAIKLMYGELVRQEKEINERKGLRRNEPTSQSTGVFKTQVSQFSGVSSADKLARLQSPNLKAKLYK